MRRKSGLQWIISLGAGMALTVAWWPLPGLGSSLHHSLVEFPPLASTIESPELPPLGDPNQLLPSPLPPIRLVIRLSERRVYVYDGDDLKTSYPIAIGRSGWETPTGEFKVIQKIASPAWQNPFTGEVIAPGEDNPLGTRWIGFWTDGQNYIGFHGTPSEHTVGQAASHGCIRMFNQDVQALFELVTMDTPVTVVE